MAITTIGNTLICSEVEKTAAILPNGTGSFLRGNLASPASLAFGTLGVASGDSSVGEAVAGTTASVIGSTAASNAVNKVLPKLTKYLPGKLGWAAKGLSGIANIAGGMFGWSAGANLAKNTPIYKRSVPSPQMYPQTLQNQNLQNYK